MNTYRITLGLSLSWVVTADSLTEALATVGPYSIGNADRIIVERVS